MAKKQELPIVFKLGVKTLGVQEFKLTRAQAIRLRDGLNDKLKESK